MIYNRIIYNRIIYNDYKSFIRQTARLVVNDRSKTFHTAAKMINKPYRPPLCLDFVLLFFPEHKTDDIQIHPLVALHPPWNQVPRVNYNMTR